MGCKVHPNAFRLGYITNFSSRWCIRDNYIFYIKQDKLIRDYIHKKYSNVGVVSIDIERMNKNVNVILKIARLYGYNNQAKYSYKNLPSELSDLIGTYVNVKFIEIANPLMSATLIAQKIGYQLSKRNGFKRVMKNVTGLLIEEHVKGVKIKCSGRIDGAEISRVEVFHYGSVPLQTKSANIDYGIHVARTLYGVLGIKVWLYRGRAIPLNKQNK